MSHDLSTFSQDFPQKSKKPQKRLERSASDAGCDGGGDLILRCVDGEKMVSSWESTLESWGSCLGFFLTQKTQLDYLQTL